MLGNLNRLTHRLREVVVVDSSDERLEPGAFVGLDKLSVVYLSVARSVCVRRNVGIDPPPAQPPTQPPMEAP